MQHHLNKLFVVSAIVIVLGRLLIAQPTSSPSHLVFASNSTGNYEIFSSNIDGTNKTQLTDNPADDILPKINFNGDKIGFLSNRNGQYYVYSMNLNGGNLTQITNRINRGGQSGHGSGDFCWTPDGSIYFTAGTNIFKVDGNGLNEQLISTSATARNFRTIVCSPSNKIAAMEEGSWAYNREIYVMNLDGTNKTLLIPNDPGIIWLGGFNFDGHKLLYCWDTTGHEESSGKQLADRLFLINLDGTMKTQVSYGILSNSNDSPGFITTAGTEIICCNEPNDYSTPPELWKIDLTTQTRSKILVNGVDPQPWYEILMTGYNVHLSSPNGGEVWECGTVKNIIFNAYFPGPRYINLQYSSDNGISWNDIVNHYLSVDTYSWTVPSISSDQMLIEITASDMPLFDISDSTSRVYKAITITITPTGGGSGGGGGSGSQNSLNFGGTNVTLDMWVSDPSDISVTFHAYEKPDSSASPSEIKKVSEYYWTLSAASLSFDSGYIKAPIYTFRGVDNASNLRWLHRTNSSDPWTNIEGTLTPDGYLKSTIPFSTLGEFAIGTIGLDPLPVELSSFISIPNGRMIQLNWETKTEKNSNKFNIERKTIGTNWESIGSVKAAVLSNSPKQYSFIDKNLQSGKYQYRLKMIDNDGTFEYSKVIEIEVTVPKNFELSQNFPNPFNPETKINYNLPFDSWIILEVYNITGQRIGQLVNEEQSAGYYSIDFNLSSINRSISSGIYFYRMTAVDKAAGNNFSAIKKMILIK